ncbi:polysaccharide pyruvyl transferase family protein [uncultured Algoriphagus sp.]|uniref:polysaccharide pyruvyl transferase family protein n=1 Tax=uncultured Algoriphagus sp. TaxID=417365 RepID=UPI0030EF1721|tara:strand:+ start:19687 stop:20895 length:1209 start_codon:yes stop_codon:yes gene_type:complete
MKPNSEINIAIVWANPYSGNLGVGALAYSALSLIHDTLDEHDLKGKISFWGSSKEGEDFVSINSKRIEFHNIVGLDYGNPKSWIKMLLKPIRFGTIRMFSFDCVFDIAEGDSFSDIYGDVRFKRILNSKMLFSRLGIKQVMLPQTIGPFSSPKNEKLAFNAMGKVHKVIGRDLQSYNYSKKHLPESKILESIDVAFYMPFERKEFDGKNINIGINVSGLLWNGGYTKNNQFKMMTDYKVLVTKTIEYFSKLNGVKVHLIPHVVPANMSVEDDYAVSLEIKELYPNVVVPSKFVNPIEAKSYISGLDFFTGGRMHSCIAAFSSGVPVVPMAYSRKFNGLFKDTLQYKWMGDCVNSSEEDVLREIIHGYENRATLAEDIAKSEKEIIKPRLNRLKEILYESLIK